MALVQKRDPKKTILLAVVLVAVLAGAGLTYWLLTREPVSTTTSSAQSRDLPIITSFGEDLLNSQRVKNLKSYGQLPVPAEPFGNNNPFLLTF